jgi:hypothetical protein
MHGPDVRTLNVFIDNFEAIQNKDFNRTVFWTKTGNLADFWFSSKRTISSATPWRVVFEGIVDYRYRGNIAIDDISLVSGACGLAKECNFLDGFCDFTNTGSDLLWKVGQPSSSSIDHTTSANSGAFAYVDNKPTTTSGSKARLSSKRYPPTGKECLKFWYLLSGDTITQLNIYETLFGTLGNAVWTKNGHAVDEWRYSQHTIGYLSTELFGYSFVFEGIATSNSTIGIDDISIVNGPCPDPINCNFEEINICSWTQSKDDQMNWLLGRGQGDTTLTGPHVDATTGTEFGWYLYIDSSYPAKKGDTAILLSEYLVEKKISCFSLWYFMHGRDVGQLQVLLYDSMNNFDTLDYVSGEQGFGWRQLFVNVSNDQEFRIGIMGIVIKITKKK